MRDLVLHGLIRFSVLLALSASLFFMPAACSIFTPENARTVLDAAKVACAIERASLDDQTIARVCEVQDALVPDLRQVLISHRVAVARSHVTSCRGSAAAADAGPDAR